MLRLVALCMAGVCALRSGCAVPPQGVARGGGPLRSVSVGETIESFERMKASAEEMAPFSDEELGSVISSLIKVGMADSRAKGLKEVLSRSAHLSHKRWHMTEACAASLAAELPQPGAAGDPFGEFGQIFEKVLAGGNWDAAAAFASRRPSTEKPWVVLVTGVNGIRKTTSIYEPWFGEALAEALVGPDGAPAAPAVVRSAGLPAGSNSFFRQLDFVIATVANEAFAALYGIDDVDAYAAAKDAIFARYRMVSEMVGAALVKRAKALDLNVMLETSGRDVAMFAYVDHFFDDAKYNKLALNFEIDDLSYAERSVDARMVGEMARGKAAVESGDVASIVDANAGGPYGSAVLAGVQAASRDVWKKVAANDADGVGASWHKAALRITPRDDGPWTLAADVDGATTFQFTPRS